MLVLLAFCSAMVFFHFVTVFLLGPPTFAVTFFARVLFAGFASFLGWLRVP